MGAEIQSMVSDYSHAEIAAIVRRAKKQIRKKGETPMPGWRLRVHGRGATVVVRYGVTGEWTEAI